VIFSPSVQKFHSFCPGRCPSSLGAVNGARKDIFTTGYKDLEQQKHMIWTQPVFQSFKSILLHHFIFLKESFDENQELSIFINGI
jgi:hypothetical protein